MIQDNKNRINNLLKNYNNISILIGDLLDPINEVMKKYSCNIDEACNIKFKAEDYLKNYGQITLNSTTKAINKIIEEEITI